ncbi:MAG: hypothetical protein CYG60_20025 [Actinobacteria bacterium]|nr:MAG: hypothetical protein CYG60_20025 [Actinomycetota bacterium]
MSRTGDKAMVLMVVVTLAVGILQLDPLGTAKLPKWVEMLGCDGQLMRFDGKKAELLRLHNEERAERGAPALCAHPQLEAAAQGHAEDMLKRGFYEHVTPEGMDPGQRISRTGYPYATYGENNNRVWGDFAGEPSRQELREAVESWMDSPGHRKTLLNPALREVGFGITTGRYAPERGTTTMYAADFGTRR